MINLKRILCAVDLTESSMLALGLAQAVAGRYGSFLTIIHVLENPYLDIPGGKTGAFSFGELADLYREEREERIIDFLKRKDAPSARFDILFEEGVPYEKITEVAREIKADMIMMATCTGGPHEPMAGHTTERVVRLAPCPVMSVRVDVSSREKLKRQHDLMDTDPTVKRAILLPTDFSQHSVLAANYAISIAQEYKAELFVLHVLERVAEVTPVIGSDMPGYESVLVYYEDLLKMAQTRIKEICDLASEHKVTTHERIISGNPRHEILAFAKSQSVDLIVIGTHGRSGFSRLIQGSVAEVVVRHAPCSVLSVKRPEHDFIAVG